MGFVPRVLLLPDQCDIGAALRDDISSDFHEFIL
jgi:hypothetical protein